MSAHACYFRVVGDVPVVATAIHDGHRVRPDTESLLALSPQDRRREEDPFTSCWTTIATNRVIALHSRFEVDLNRPRERAIYWRPSDAWGLDVCNRMLPTEFIDASLAQYDAFYDSFHSLLGSLEKTFGRFVVYDLHSYNHRRMGSKGPPDDPEQNPEINLGTGTMDRKRWGAVVDRFLDILADTRLIGRPFDARENVKFRGGHLSQWVHRNFPRTGCCLAIEVKKMFMDEWSGVPDYSRIRAIREALRATVPGVVEALQS